MLASYNRCGGANGTDVGVRTEQMWGCERNRCGGANGTDVGVRREQTLLRRIHRGGDHKGPGIEAPPY